MIALCFWGRRIFASTSIVEALATAAPLHERRPELLKARESADVSSLPRASWPNPAPCLSLSSIGHLRVGPSDSEKLLWVPMRSCTRGPSLTSYEFVSSGMAQVRVSTWRSTRVVIHGVMGMAAGLRNSGSIQ